jgi:aspartate aminotransferase
MAISKKIKASISQSSMIRRMFEQGVELKKKFGADKVYDFSLGNPNVPPPEAFKNELIGLIREEIPFKHGYPPNAGIAEVRQAVADKISKTTGLKMEAGHIVMSCGAGGALNVILKALLDPGDEVVVPVPYFVEYAFYVENYGGVLTKAKTAEDFSLDISSLAGAITGRTKAVIINSPNNPTGRVYAENEITALAKLLAQKGREYGKTIYLISDEPYAEIVFDGIKVPSALKAYPDSILAYSYSKTLSVPGERIGYIAVNPAIDEPRDLIDAIILCTRISGFVNAPALMQRVIARLQDVTIDVGVYQKKRDLLCGGLSKAGYQFALPQGAFYLFVKSPLADDVKFTEKLIEQNILAVPGSGFGAPGYFRIAYCVDDKVIAGSMGGFAAAIRECV